MSDIKYLLVQTPYYAELAIEEGAVVADEAPPKPDPVQQTVDTMVDHLRAGRTTDAQDATLTKALSDRRVQRAFQR